MRKLFLLFWAFLATTCLWAHNFEVDGIYYNYLADNNVAVTYKGSSIYEYSNEYYGEVTIPATVTHDGTIYSVTSIGDWAFGICSSLNSITIPNSVTSIGKYAFLVCSSLTSITIPNSVTSIGNYAFRDCSSLTSMVVEEGNTTYDSRDNCNAIIETATNTLIAGCQNTIIPNSVTSIGDWAFSYCSSLSSVTIPNSVTSIGSSAFQYCSSLTSITIPNSVTSIGNSAFNYCSSLTSITIPNSVTSIGNSAFDYCSSLTSIIIPNSVTSIGERAFEHCSSLTSVTIGNSVTSIGDYAFSDCSKLTSVTIPDSVTSIGNYAFACGYNLGTVSFKGKTPPAMGEGIFYDSNPTWVVPCGAYDVYASTEIAQQYVYAIEERCIGGECGDYLTWTYDEDTHELAISGMYEMYDYVGSGPWGAYVNEITSITMEEGITYIGIDAFANCKYVQTLTIPTSVEKIGNSAFENCRLLSEINFAEDGALTEIGNWAFYNCHELKNVVIPEGVTNVGYAAFYGCTYLKELTLPASMQSVADNGFALCEKLEKMNVNAIVPPVVEARTFEDVDRSIPVYVPDAAVNDYKAAPVWQEFNIVGKEGVSTSMDNVDASNHSTQKLLRDGNLVIIRDGVEYNVMGQQL